MKSWRIEKIADGSGKKQPNFSMHMQKQISRGLHLDSGYGVKSAIKDKNSFLAEDESANVNS